MLWGCSGDGETLVEQAGDVPDVESIDSTGDSTVRPECLTSQDCDDYNPCTENTCRWDRTCVFLPLSGLPCDDGNPCTTADVCLDDGTCAGPDPLECVDSDQCTQDDCDPAEGCVFPPAADGLGCDDGDLCTTGDQCLEGECLGLAPTCHDGDDCTADSCSPDTGDCQFLSQSNYPCDDGNACTNGDICQEGICIPGVPVDCTDADPCTIDDCLELPTDQGGGCTHEPDVGLACDDANVCTQDDQCNSDGECLGQPIDCDDSNPCTSDYCHAATGCYQEPTGGGPCEDSDPCTGTGKCAYGECQPGPLLDCTDDFDCTADSCNQEGECVHLPMDDLCDDGVFCNGPEECHVDSGCQSGTPVALDVSLTCTLDECNEADQLVEHLPQNELCDDNDLCTLDACSPAEGCITSPKVCLDDDPCTLDSCDPTDGQCLFELVQDCCTAHGDCEGDGVCIGGYCNAETLTCATAPYLCDDFDPCTLDSCDGGCQHQPVAECDNQCGKAADCTLWQVQDDLCTYPLCLATDPGGPLGCVFIPGQCDDGLPCTIDTCQPEMGCQFWPDADCTAACENNQDCDDRDACTFDLCSEGMCSNISKKCDDGQKCTVDWCHRLTGDCVFEECDDCECETCVTNEDCDDQDPCSPERCIQPPGLPADAPRVCRVLHADCNDGNPCTVDSCIPDEGCSRLPLAQCVGCMSHEDCDDNNECTAHECLPSHRCEQTLVCDSEE